MGVFLLGDFWQFSIPGGLSGPGGRSCAGMLLHMTSGLSTKNKKIFGNYDPIFRNYYLQTGKSGETGAREGPDWEIP
jgi:hypothetical protein